MTDLLPAAGLAPPRPARRRQPFELLIKPAGAACNLVCTYCFYLGKIDRPGTNGSLRMSDTLLDRLTQQCLAAADGAEAIFAWQGGEPTLMGLDFFRRAVALQRQHGAGRPIRNTLQTNGVLLDDAWGAFLAEHRFLVGLSVDGPAALHDSHRVDRAGRATHDAVRRGLDVLKRHGVEFNTVTAIHRDNARDPQAVYDFLDACGARHWQFIPVVERQPESPAQGVRDHRLGSPPGSAGPGSATAVTAWSVVPEAYGEFLTRVFDRWVRADVGRVFIQTFEVALGNWLRADAGLCVFAETCGRGLAVAADGDVFACDHYVHANYRLGNLADRPLAELLRSPALERFGRHKADALPGWCRRCPYLFACRGECPKNRFALAPDGEPGLSYLCPAYRRFFAHVDPCLRLMAQYLLRGRSPATIMEALASP
jgi:uncharacterized protein